MLDVFQIALRIVFFMDFGAILAPSWEAKWSQNRYKMVLKKSLKKLTTFDSQPVPTLMPMWPGGV